MAERRSVRKSDGVSKDDSGKAAVEVPAQTKVLLAEDDESFIDALVIGLTREGFAVTVATDGTEALRLFAEVEPDPPVHVLGDRRQLVSAIHSLLENAVAFSYEGGTVRVEGGQADQSVRLSVSDSGVGIPSRDLDRIFERFYRVDHGRSRETGGTGLGLSIVRHVAANHQGRVEVDSREGEGSTFTLILPSPVEYAA